ncbi:MAG: DUF983 domain-containing protein [Inquilinus sp.]|nr:DUF983 domain-containing protein [Inquilinus sp.]
MAAGLSCKCPRCGRGALFDGYLTVAESCSACGLDLRKADSGDGPAVFLIFIIGFLAVPLAFWIEVSFTPPVWVHAVTSGGFIIGLALLLLRPAKALVLGLQFRHRPEDFGDGGAG